MKTPLTILAGIAALSLQAQDLLPDLAPPAARHQQQTAAINEQKSAALARALQTYMAALEAAEKVATTAAQLAAVAAIAREREAAARGPLSSVFPADLPKSLQPARKKYLQTATQLRGEFSPRQRQIDSDYLRALAFLQPKAAANANLAQQIAAEKKRILDQAAAEAAADGLTGTRWSFPAGYADARESEAWIEFKPNGEVLIGWHKPEDGGTWKLAQDGKVQVGLWKDKSILETLILDPDKKEAIYRPRHAGEMRIRRLIP